MQKKQLIIWIVVILIVVAIGVVVGMRLGRSTDAAGASTFTAVYLSTGDVYFGRFSSFPSPHMTHVWYLQRGTDAQNQPQLSVAPLSNVFWGPADGIKFNRNDIVFSVRLRNDSQVVRVMTAAEATAPQPANPGLAAPSATPPVPAQPTTSTSQ